MKNAEIVNLHLRSGLIDRCIRFQMRAAGEMRNMNDVRQDVCLLLMRYDNARLNEIHGSGHMNAFLTQVLRREFHSARSAYHYRYRRHEQSRYALACSRKYEQQQT